MVTKTFECILVPFSHMDPNLSLDRLLGLKMDFFYINLHEEYMYLTLRSRFADHNGTKDFQNRSKFD